MIIFLPFGTTPDPLTPGVDMTGMDLVREAFLERGIYSPSDTLSGEDADHGLSKLNRLFDRWNANERTSFATAFTGYTLTPNLSPHTIGPTGTFVVPDRPLRLDGINLVLPGGIRRPITLRDQAWYQDRRVPGLATSIPTDCYYEPTHPNGHLYFWPVPTTAYPIDLWAKGFLSALTLDALLSAPQGYRDAIILTLAESLFAFGVPMPEGLPAAALEARAIAFANNDDMPRLQTDAPFGSGSSAYDYRTGMGR